MRLYLLVLASSLVVAIAANQDFSHDSGGDPEDSVLIFSRKDKKDGKVGETSSATTTSEESKPFRQLPGTIWPVHYDLFVQPLISEPFDFTGQVSKAKRLF